jgi:hypothetical protein
MSYNNNSNVLTISTCALPSSCKITLFCSQPTPHTPRVFMNENLPKTLSLEISTCLTVKSAHHVVTIVTLCVHKIFFLFVNFPIFSLCINYHKDKRFLFSVLLIFTRQGRLFLARRKFLYQKKNYYYCAFSCYKI